MPKIARTKNKTSTAGKLPKPLGQHNRLDAKIAKMKSTGGLNNRLNARRPNICWRWPFPSRTLRRLEAILVLPSMNAAGRARIKVLPSKVVVATRDRQNRIKRATSRGVWGGAAQKSQLFGIHAGVSMIEQSCPFTRRKGLSLIQCLYAIYCCCLSQRLEEIRISSSMYRVSFAIPRTKSLLITFNM